MSDLAESDGYFRVVGVRVLAGEERPIEPRPDHERVHGSLHVAVAVVAARSRRPVIRLVRAYNDEPPRTTTASKASLPRQHVTEMEVFRMLDRLKPTATGLDKIGFGLGFVSLGPFHCARFIFVLCITVCCVHDCLGL